MSEPCAKANAGSDRRGISAIPTSLPRWPLRSPTAYGTSVLLAERFRPTPTQYLRITQVALVALCAIIVTGAGVRLTGSGLGCSDWPLCEEGELVAALEFHPMVEFVNRLITGLVSVAVIAAVLGSLRRIPKRRDLTRWSWGLVLGVVAQIIIGAFVTKTELKYSVVAVHFLVSMVLVWASVVLIIRSADTELDDLLASGGDLSSRSKKRWTTEAKALVTLGTAVLISGATVTSAGKHPGARPDTYGVEHVVKRLPLDIGSVVRIHSLLVWALCAVTVLIVLRLRTRGPAAMKAATELLVVIVAQGGLGYIQYFSGVPALMVAFHVAGSILVWVMTLRLAFATASLPATVDRTATDPRVRPSPTAGR